MGELHSQRNSSPSRPTRRGLLATNIHEGEDPAVFHAHELKIYSYQIIHPCRSAFSIFCRLPPSAEAAGCAAARRLRRQLQRCSCSTTHDNYNVFLRTTSLVGASRVAGSVTVPGTGTYCTGTGSATQRRLCCWHACMPACMHAWKRGRQHNIHKPNPHLIPDYRNCAD